MFLQRPNRIVSMLGLGLLLIFCAQAALSAARAPLLQPGKKTIYQRVLTRPGAELVSQLGRVSGEAQPAFSRFYVYQRVERAGTEWLEVGVDTKGNTVGWLPAAMTVPWKQQLALAFTNPAGRERALFFKDRRDLQAILASSEPEQDIAPLRLQIEQGGRDNRIVAIEPEVHVDIDKQFYLLPMLAAEEIYTGLGPTARLLKVASVTKQSAAATDPADSNDANQSAPALLRNFSAAVVFVIDSTISMGPYIERTRTGVRRIYQRIEQAGLQNQVKFGLVAYRSNVDAVPGLEYVAREFADPAEVRSGDDFLRQVADLKPAPVSSKRFDEDAYAGIMLALAETPWNRFGARYLILITDAGALEGNDELSQTRLGAAQVRSEAQRLGVAIYTLHLKTPEGKNNHRHAEQQYSTLAEFPPAPQPLYFPIEMGSVATFGKIIDSLADSLVTYVQGAARGETVPGSAKTSEPARVRNPQDPQLRRLQESTALVGHAMQLAYLGRARGTQAPPVLEGWITDLALDDPDRRTVNVRVLLTKRQLSDIQLVLREILDVANRSKLDTRNFYDSLRSLAARLGRDPNLITQAQTTKLADLGLLDEYLQDLPYKSQVMNIDQDTWSRWSVQQQDEFIRTVERKLRHYEIYNRDVGRWIALAENSPASEYVYPVPLDDLP